MEVEITIVIVASISGVGAALVSGTSMETGAPPQGFLWLSGTQLSPGTLGGAPLGQHPYPLCPGALALGSLQMRWTQKHPPGPTILLLRGIRPFYTSWNCGCGTSGVPQVCRIHSLQQQPFGRNGLLPTSGIPVLCLPYC